MARMRLYAGCFSALLSIGSFRSRVPATAKIAFARCMHGISAPIFV